jgi:O-antigen ligase
MLRKLFFLFIFFAPLTSFFAISPWLRLPVIINQSLFCVLLISILISGKLIKKWLVKEDLFLIAFLSLVWLSFMLGFKEQRSFNHSLAYTNSIIFYFFVSKYVINRLSVQTLEITRIVYQSFLFCSFIIIVDFIGINYFNFSLRKIYAQEVDGAISNMDYFFKGNMYRVGGVAEEPGQMANFYNIYFGLTLYYLYKKQALYKIKWILILFLISHFAMFSSAGITLALLAFLVIFVWNRLKKFSINKSQLNWIFGAFFSLLILLLVFSTKLKNSISEIYRFIDKITFNESANEVTSSGARIYQWKRAIYNFYKKPIFGHGPGYGVNEDAEGYLSVYLTILSDVGIFAFLFFILFQLSLVVKVISTKGILRDFILFCIITSFLHLAIVADFYQAPVWILFFIIQQFYKESKLETL